MNQQNRSRLRPQRDFPVRGDKSRRYARAGVADYWIVSVRERTIEMRRDPEGIGYHTSIVLSGSEEARPLVAPHIAVTPNELFLP